MDITGHTGERLATAGVLFHRGMSHHLTHWMRITECLNVLPSFLSSFPRKSSWSITSRGENPTRPCLTQYSVKVNCGCDLAIRRVFQWSIYTLRCMYNTIYKKVRHCYDRANIHRCGPVPTGSCPVKPGSAPSSCPQGEAHPEGGKGHLQTAND